MNTLLSLPAAWLPTPALAGGLVFLILFTYGYACDNGYLYPRRPEKIRLTARTLQPKVANTNVSHNRFAREYDQLFLHVMDVLDMAACRYIDGSELPVLIQQEHNHALMHRANKMSTSAARFAPIRFALDFAMLRSGKAIGQALFCACECAGSAMYYSIAAQRVIPQAVSPAVLFHMLEEIEHGAVTTAHLKKNIPVYVRFAVLPVLFAMLFTHNFGAVFTHLVTNPRELVEVGMYRELFLYLVAFTPSFLLFWSEFVQHFLPFGNEQGETLESRDALMRGMLELCNEAEMEFALGNTAEYEVVM